MNVERILQLADVIEKVPHAWVDGYKANGELDSFNMRYWHCGTTGCIAGWASELFGGRPNYAYTKLDITSSQGEALFTPEDIRLGLWPDITPLQAATVLRHLAATGIVDWSVATPVDGEVK